MNGILLDIFNPREKYRSETILYCSTKYTALIKLVSAEPPGMVTKHGHSFLQKYMSNFLESNCILFFTEKNNERKLIFLFLFARLRNPSGIPLFQFWKVVD